MGRAAVSFTGVRGLMQLTEDTAARCGPATAATRARASSAGPSTLRTCSVMPRRIREPDRTWLAVAAYNVGLGHLEDARVLAQAHGRIPIAGRTSAASCRC